jgi:hypothetical protein
MFKPDPSTANPRDHLAKNGMRLVGAVVALAVFALLLTALLVTMSLVGASEKAALYVGKAFTYSAVGALFIGWKWPHTVVSPFQRTVVLLLAWVQRTVSTRLVAPVQRGLFLVAAFTLWPWAIARLVPELWESSSVRQYLRSVFYPVFSTVFEVSRWGYEPAWYDWLVAIGIVCFALAFAWPWTGARMLVWVRGADPPRSTEK